MTREEIIAEINAELAEEFDQLYDYIEQHQK